MSLISRIVLILVLISLPLICIAKLSSFSTNPLAMSHYTSFFPPHLDLAVSKSLLPLVEACCVIITSHLVAPCSRHTLFSFHSHHTLLSSHSHHFIFAIFISHVVFFAFTHTYFLLLSSCVSALLIVIFKSVYVFSQMSGVLVFLAFQCFSVNA